jgi:hypothetical protein
MTRLPPLEIPDLGLTEADPPAFRARFSALVEAAMAREAALGEAQRQAEELRAALDAERARADAAEALAQSHAEALAVLREEHALAVAAYRQARLDGDPSLPPAMVEGETIAAVDAAIARARDVVAYVRDQIARDTSAAQPAARTVPRVPGGAPGRLPVDSTRMTTREKLEYGAELARQGRV